MNAIKTNEEWLSVIQECRASGLPDRTWCHEHGITLSSFYYNLRKLRKLACDIPESQNRSAVPIAQEVVPLRITDDGLPISGLIPQVQADPGDAVSVSVEGKGISITFTGNVSPAMVCSVMEALQKRC